MIHYTVTVDCPNARQLVRQLGIDAQGDVQRFYTATVLRRMRRYMPHRTGMLETKQTRITGDTEITAAAPGARMLYFGKVMVDPAINAAGFKTANGEWRSRRGAVKQVTTRDLQYDTTFNRHAGPYWDRRMVAAEGDQLAAELAAYIHRRIQK